MDSIAGNNPTNNPRLDLLHNSGDNQQLAGAAGSYGPDAKAPPPPAPKVEEPKAAAKYVSTAQSSRPATPVPLPPPTPEPRRAPATTPGPSQPKNRRPVIITIVVLLILAAIGGGVWWWLSTHKPKPAAPAPAPVTVTPVTPTGLTQTDSANANLTEGGTTKQTKVSFQFSAQTSANSGSLTPEVELEPSATAFTGQPNLTGSAVSASKSMQFTVTSATLAQGTYHWQARLSAGSQHGQFAVFGGDVTATAFTVSTVAPTAPTVSTIGGVAVANPTVVTSNRPVFAGKADPNAVVTVKVSPDSQTFTATADSSGAWTLTPSADIPNGSHQLTITAANTAGSVSTPTQVALTVNPATAADTTPAPAAASTTPAASPPAAVAATPTPAPAKKLAATGDNTTLVSLASLLAMVMAAAGIVVMRRRYARF